MQRTAPRLTTTRLSNPEVGTWCVRCLLPSGAVWTSLVECDGRPHSVLVVAVCLECGEEL